MTALYFVLQAVFWAPFLVRGRLDHVAGSHRDGATAHAAPRASMLVWAHGGAFALLYGGAGWSLWSGGDAVLPLPVRLLAVPIMLASTWAMIRVMLVFRSWRLRAVLTEAHELCTEGPFSVVRHPIYTGLMAVGVATLLVAPNVLTAAGFLLNVLVGDLRARTEERLLLAAFGERYAAYMARTRRFVPRLDPQWRRGR